MKTGIYYKAMRIVITVKQLKHVLETESLHLPIVIRMERITKEEFQELSVLLKKKRD